MIFDQRNKRNVSVQQTQSTIPTNLPCNCSSQQQNQHQLNEPSSYPCDAKENTKKKLCACDAENKKATPIFCACDVKPNQTALTPCTCGTTFPQRQTYSAQTVTPPFQVLQNRNTACNTVPLYSVPLNGVQANAQYSCPCSSLPPPPYPPHDDLWDLQYCRWWGWNWIRRREELMKKQNAVGLQTERTLEANEVQQKKTAYSKFLCWCNKKMNGNAKKSKLRYEEKQNLQGMYDTPCSSIIVDEKGYPTRKDWECYSVNLKCDCDCCNKLKCTSTSTIIMRNKTKRHSCKHNFHRKQSWTCAQTDSTTSNEVCRCASLCAQNSQPSSTENSIEYLSLRMERIKSECDGEDNECSHDVRKSHICKHNPPKKRKQSESCPCKLIHASNCHKRAKHKSPCKDKTPADDPKTVPFCIGSPPPNKIPIFRRYLQPNYDKSLSNNGKRKKHCKCHKKEKEYTVCCTCEKSKKNPCDHDKPNKVYVCCCCNCCTCRQNTDDKQVPKEDHDLVKTADKCTSCFCQTDFGNVPLGVSVCAKLSNGVVQNPIVNNVFNSGKVSNALGGLFSSPVTGKIFTLNPKTFTPTALNYVTKLPQLFDVNDSTLLSSITPAKSADAEHKHLLQAVCNAIMSSHTSLNNNGINKPPCKCTNNIKGVGKLFPRQHSQEIAVHLYESDSTYKTEEIVDLFPSTLNQSSRAAPSKQLKDSHTFSQQKQNKKNDFELLKKVSYSSLKKIYNERTFPLKKCRIDNNLPIVEPSKELTASPSTSATERTAASSMFDEEHEKYAKKAEYYNVYNVGLYSPSTQQNPLPFDTTYFPEEFKIQVAHNNKQENYTKTRLANNKIESPFSPNLGDIQQMSSSSNFVESNVPDFIKLPTIEEQQVSIAESSSFGSEDESSFVMHNAPKMINHEMKIISGRMRTKPEGMSSLVFETNTSKVFGMEGKRTTNINNKFIKKLSNSRIEKQMEAMKKRWKR